ncbi:MAG: peptide chain release factor 1 [Deltaproteobacteria bacterium]|nr:peptide chain release factor 1 [Deltaproteobacteria bacterium]
MLPTEKLDAVVDRFHQVEEMLCSPEIASDRRRFAELGRERRQLEALVGAWQRYRDVQRQIGEDEKALGDPELRELAEAELPDLRANAEQLEQEIRTLLLPADPNDERNTLVEIRAGTGGDEAALFAADLLRMYTRFAERRSWRIEPISMSESPAGGLREVIILVTGDHVYSQLRFEGGVHRVQRVPATEAQGRIHTSTATVAVLPEADEVDVDIKAEDLEITTAAAGGPGGQGVNTTNSAVQIVHKPTGLIVKCQDERSQIKNKAKAMKVLRARLLKREEEAQSASIAAERRDMVGTAARAEKIRTYNYPQNRVTDHRIDGEEGGGRPKYLLANVIDGDLDDLVTALRTQRTAQLLEGTGST